MHVRGAEPDLGPLTGQFSGFRLRVSNLEPPNVSSGWAPSLQTFDFEGPSNSVRAFPVQHQPLDRVLQLLGEQYGDSAIKQGACARLYDMLASGKRFSPSDGDLWVDRYKPKAAADVLGNTQVVEDLASWMETRKVVLEAAPSHSRNRPGKDKRRQKRSKGRKSKRDINDFIVDSDEDLYSSGEEAESSSSTVLLVGPCGSGKTAMVEAVAAQLGFSILEISEGQKRDSKSVMSEIGEAAVNHTLVGSAAPRERASERPKDSRIAELFAGGGRSGPHQASESGEDEPDIAAMRRKARKRKVVESDSEDEAVPPRAAEPETLSSLTNDFDAEPSPEARKKRRIIRLNLSPDASQPAVHGDDDAKAALAARPASTGQTLLVFDNVDIVYEEDKGFWAAVAAVAERTKRPIVLTANSADFIESLPTSLADDLTVKDTTKPTVEQLAAYLALVCVLEGVWMEKADLIQLVEWCNGEIGRSLRAVELITLAPRSELRGTVTGQPGDSSGFIDLAVCGTAAEFDVTALRWELGQSGWGLLHRETDGVLGVLADVRIEASEPSPSPFREPPVAASVPEEASLSLRGDVEPAEAPNGDVEPAEAKLVSESASPMGQDAPKDAEQPVSPVPAKQTQSDRIRASLLEAYSTETDVISQWDAGINGGGMIRRFLVRQGVCVVWLCSNRHFPFS
ncbi:hypothetical protein DFJ74DRAFT_135022 [Hyaloraphidium curvatum]|nr:hypothetical protein DFJ74DRAFT_135022 [Hyaloraphidium curvatum]